MKFFDRLRKQAQSDDLPPDVEQRVRTALAHLEPVLASDDLSECHHRMALAASELRKVLEEPCEKKP